MRSHAFKPKPKRWRIIWSMVGGPEYPKGSRTKPTIAPKHCNTVRCTCPQCMQAKGSESATARKQRELEQALKQALLNKDMASFKLSEFERIRAEKEWAKRQHVATSGRIKDTAKTTTDELGKHIWREHLNRCGQGHGIKECPVAKSYGYQAKELLLPKEPKAQAPARLREYRTEIDHMGDVVIVSMPKAGKVPASAIPTTIIKKVF